jgi:Dehydrogenases with different specificities (related to short-chain alcohol dehydrogenases)
MQNSAETDYFDLKYKTLRGKNIILTGGSSGIGHEVAKILLVSGSNVIAIGRNREELNRLEFTLGKTGTLSVHYCDLQRPTEIKQVFTAILEQIQGKIDGIINCAGQSLIKDFQDTSLKDFDECMNINVRAAMHLMSMAVPFMKLTGGSIVNITASPVPRIKQSIFCVTKACLDSLTQCAALELANFGIRVNAVAPGITDTNFRLNQTEKPINQDVNDGCVRDAGRKSLLGGVNSAKDVAEVVVWLVSDESSYVTGEIITVDGGTSLNTATSDMEWKAEEKKEEASVFDKGFKALGIGSIFSKGSK